MCEYVGWGPHAYFQMLAEPNGVQTSSNSNYAQHAEVQILSVCIPPQHDGDNARIH